MVRTPRACLCIGGSDPQSVKKMKPLALPLVVAFLLTGSQDPKAGFTAPSMDGYLLSIVPSLDLVTLKTDHAKVSRTTQGGSPALRLDYDAGTAYPKVEFPVPAGGWNLSSFGGVRVELTNPGTAPVRAALRVDNPGDWKTSPWNTGMVEVGPGETKTLSLLFGESGFPLDASKVSAIQLFLPTPKAASSLVLRDLKAFGSPKDRTKSGSFSTPGDRDKPIKPAAWVGKKPPVPGDWVQTLNDDFNGTALNKKLWSHESWWNGLLEAQDQAYSPSMTTVRDGLLTIKFEKRTIHQNDDPKLPTRPYATSILVSYDKWTQRYGYIEARIKPPTARGLWPAFWMMPDRGKSAGPEGWKRESTKDGGMEIDIMEILTEWGAGRNNVAVHWDGYEKEHKTWGNSNVYFGPTPDGFHNFGLLWEPGKLTWYIDGVKRAEFENSRVGATPAYLIMNIQSGNWATKDVDVAKLPDTMQVDYVRAWQLKGRTR